MTATCNTAIVWVIVTCSVTLFCKAHMFQGKVPVRFFQFLVYRLRCLFGSSAYLRAALFKTEHWKWQNFWRELDAGLKKYAHFELKNMLIQVSEFLRPIQTRPCLTCIIVCLLEQFRLMILHLIKHRIMYCKLIRRLFEGGA